MLSDASVCEFPAELNFHIAGDTPKSQVLTRIGFVH